MTRTAHIKPVSMTRPSFLIEELGDVDSGFTLGRHSWTAVEFDCTLDVFDIVGPHDEIVLEYPNNCAELWQFKGVRIACCPSQYAKPVHTLDDTIETLTRFVMLFDSAQRIVRDRP